MVPRAAAPEIEHDERGAASKRERVNQPVRQLEIDSVHPSLVGDAEPRPRARQQSVAAAPRRAASANVASHPELETGVRTVPVENETLLHVPVTNQRPHALPSARIAAVAERATHGARSGAEFLASASQWHRGSSSGRTATTAPSRSGLGTRVVPQSDRPVIVHVTIDRMDVRAPAAPERAAPRTRSRAATAGSLTDYLRARPAGRQGGTS